MSTAAVPKANAFAFMAVTEGLAVTRRGKAKRYDTPTYVYEMLATGVVGKHMEPMAGRVTARSLDEFPDYVRHKGEEFLMVLEGTLKVMIDGRRPVRPKVGDSIYFNSGLGHAYLSIGPKDARILVVCWQPPGGEPPLGAWGATRHPAGRHEVVGCGVRAVG